jgi:hypothetical protein
MDQAQRLRQARIAIERDDNHAWRNSSLETKSCGCGTRLANSPNTIHRAQPCQIEQEQDPERWDGLS